MLKRQRIPRVLKVIGFVGDSGSGKTTLIAKIVTILTRKGYRIGVIKHSSGFTDPDPKGKDSYILRRAGATRMLLTSRDQSVFFESHPKREPSLKERLSLFTGYDLVLVESWKSAKLPSVVVTKQFRPDAKFVAQLIEENFLKR